MQATGADMGLQVSGYGRDVSLYIGLQAACTWIFHKVQAAFCITFGLCTAAPGNDRRAAQTQGRAQPVAINAPDKVAVRKCYLANIPVIICPCRAATAYASAQNQRNRG